METLYRKVALSERKPTKSGTYFSNEGEVFYSSAYKEFQHNYDPHTMYPDWWLEPIKSDQTQIEKLEADKAELLEALEKVRDYHYNGYLIDSEFNGEIETLIQKHKQ